jgi:hypothetical protein
LNLFGELRIDKTSTVRYIWNPREIKKIRRLPYGSEG